ncbi:hypothetical protein [Polyangium jinanense]|uniref:Uncharacterized protein n=1 Tax=Polyangium jinanense TaxID=2829994 RepID=A0A9X4AXP4_9BACT|nr:hypothetical protein [Polyangium jinanense]MDC3962077.1 hypothetical protein [Polyangium jinanense]MDC3988793.1 hypothetical protein [Polyangium jinanense]
MNDMINRQPCDPAVSLFGQGKSSAEIWSALVSSGVAPAAAEAHVNSLLLAVALLGQGKSAVEIWSALVSSGAAPAAAETLVRDLVEVRRMQLARQREEEEHRSSGFCKRCYDESTPLSPGNISTVNGTGTMFYGEDRGCCDCGSVVRVHWVVFCGLPLIPLGTYRYRDLYGEGTSSKFLARRTQTNSQQIAIHYSLSLVVLFVFVAVVMAIRSGNR